MGTMKKIALTSAIGLTLLSGAALAAAPQGMQSAADSKAKEISTAVNSGVELSCKDASLRISKAAVSKKNKLQGVQLNAAVRDATHLAAVRNGIAGDCVTVTLASETSNIVTGIGPQKAAVIGKAGGAGAVGGLAGLLGGAGVASALVPLAVLGGIAAVASSDNDPVSP